MRPDVDACVRMGVGIARTWQAMKFRNRPGTLTWLHAE